MNQQGGARFTHPHTLWSLAADDIVVVAFAMSGLGGSKDPDIFSRIMAVSGPFVISLLFGYAVVISLGLLYGYNRMPPRSFKVGALTLACTVVGGLYFRSTPGDVEITPVYAATVAGFMAVGFLGWRFVMQRVARSGGGIPPVDDTSR